MSRAARDTMTSHDLIAAAWALRQCHDETGIDLTGWTPVRRFVEALTGSLEDDRGAPTTPRDYTVGLPVTVRVYPEGDVVFLVHPEDATLEAEAEGEDADVDPDVLAADLKAIETALDRREATGLVDRRHP